MEKKAYIKPEMEVLEIEVQSPMLAASELKDAWTDTDEEDGQLVNSYRPNRRGQWGNLWSSEN